MNAWLKWITISGLTIAGAAATIATSGLAAPLFMKIAAASAGVSTLTGVLMRSPIKALQSPPPDKGAVPDHEMR
jgi:hypothetical protein